jgi:hypothetical protein
MERLLRAALTATIVGTRAGVAVGVGVGAAHLTGLVVALVTARSATVATGTPAIGAGVGGGSQFGWWARWAALTTSALFGEQSLASG